MQEARFNPQTNLQELKFAKFCSYVFHPLLMPTYGFLLIFYTNNYFSVFINSAYKFLIPLVTFIFTFLLPVLNALILLKFKKIQSIEMKTQSERKIPFGTTSIYYFVLFYLFYQKNFPVVFTSIILGAGVCILLCFIINFKWKISAHAIGVGGMVGALLGIIYRYQIDLNSILYLFIFIAGIVGYSRLKLNAHNTKQVYTGFALGIIVEMILIFIL